MKLKNEKNTELTIVEDYTIMMLAERGHLGHILEYGWFKHQYNLFCQEKIR